MVRGRRAVRPARADHALASGRVEPRGRSRPGRGTEQALAIVDGLDLNDHQYLHSTRGELLRRLGRTVEARAAYERALKLASSELERRFLARRIAEL